MIHMAKDIVASPDKEDTGQLFLNARSQSSGSGYLDVYIKLNSVVLVREPTMPTELPPLLGEVIANFCG
jgi:hypothetical protein